MNCRQIFLIPSSQASYRFLILLLWTGSSQSQKPSTMDSCCFLSHPCTHHSPLFGFLQVSAFAHSLQVAFQGRNSQTNAKGLSKVTLRHHPRTSHEASEKQPSK